MRTFYKLVATVAAFVPAALLAQGAEHRFTHQGVTYTYTITPDDHGRPVIEGRSQPGGSGFRLIVDGDRVEGVSGGQQVSFRTPRGGAVALAAK